MLVPQHGSRGVLLLQRSQVDAAIFMSRIHSSSAFKIVQSHDCNCFPLTPPTTTDIYTALSGRREGLNDTRANLELGKTLKMREKESKPGKTGGRADCSSNKDP